MLREMAETQKKRLGRPPLTPGEVKRNIVTISLTDKARDQIGEAARKSGRSVSGEIDYRLNQSFRDDQWVEAIARNVVEILAATPEAK